MILFAWTIVRQNRRREDARVELLSGLAFPDGVPVTAEVAPIDAFPLHVQLASDEFLSEATTAAPAETLFREPEKSGAGSRRMIALAAVCAITVMVVSVSAWLDRRELDCHNGERCGGAGRASDARDGASSGGTCRGSGRAPRARPCDDARRTRRDRTTPQSDRRRIAPRRRRGRGRAGSARAASPTAARPSDAAC